MATYRLTSTPIDNTNFYYQNPQGQYVLIFSSKPAEASPPDLPPMVQAVAQQALQGRAALASMQNRPRPIEPLAASPAIPKDLKQNLIGKVAEVRMLAGLRRDGQVDNSDVSHEVVTLPPLPRLEDLKMPSPFLSNLFYNLPLRTFPPGPVQRALPPLAEQQQPQPQAPTGTPQLKRALDSQTAIPVAQPGRADKRARPEQGRSDQQQVPVLTFSFKAAGPDFAEPVTPESYRKAQLALAERRARLEKAPPKPEKELPKPEKELVPAPRERAAPRRRKPAAAGLDFRDPLTPKNYLAVLAKAKRTRSIEPYYESSEDAKEASCWISEASNYLDEKEYTEAVSALHLAYESLPEDGFIYNLMIEFDEVICTNFDPRICTSDPEEDLDVLVLRAIRKIKFGKYEAAKTDLQKVLNRHPNDQFARLIFDHACLLSNRTAQQGELDQESAEKVTNYDSVKSSKGEKPVF